MRQFDIVENVNPLTRSRYPFAIVLQHARVSDATTRIVAPLTQQTSKLGTSKLGTSKLHPPIIVVERTYLLLTEEPAAAHPRSLGRIVGSAESQRYAIIAAIDLCFTGF